MVLNQEILFAWRDIRGKKLLLNLVGNTVKNNTTVKLQRVNPWIHMTGRPLQWKIHTQDSQRSSRDIWSPEVDGQPKIFETSSWPLIVDSFHPGHQAKTLSNDCFVFHLLFIITLLILYCPSIMTHFLSALYYNGSVRTYSILMSSHIIKKIATAKLPTVDMSLVARPKLLDDSSLTKWNHREW